MKSIKKKLKHLKAHLKISILFILFSLFSCKVCDKEDIKVFNAANKGNLGIVKKYLENGGNPLLKCHDKHGGKFGTNYNLPMDVMSSKSYPLVSYYLTKKIPFYIKDDFLLSYLFWESNDDLIILLVSNQAHITRFSNKCYSGNDIIKYLKRLEQFDYNFNWIDPKDGNNILMKYAKCSAKENDEDLLNLIKYFVKIGVKTDIKNNNGKTAYEIAVNEKVKAYLKLKN